MGCQAQEEAKGLRGKREWTHQVESWLVYSNSYVERAPNYRRKAKGLEGNKMGTRRVESRRLPESMAGEHLPTTGRPRAWKEIVRVHCKGLTKLVDGIVV